MYLFGVGVNDDQGQLAVLFGDARVVRRSVGDAFLVVALDGGDGVVTAAVVAVAIIRETHIDRIGITPTEKKTMKMMPGARYLAGNIRLGGTYMTVTMMATAAMTMAIRGEL